MVRAVAGADDGAADGTADVLVAGGRV